MQLRANVEGLRLGSGVLERLAEEGERGSMRYVVAEDVLRVILMRFTSYALQLLTPASILAGLAGRTQVEVDDIGEMNELFFDAKTSARNIGPDGGFDGGRL